MVAVFCFQCSERTHALPLAWPPHMLLCSLCCHQVTPEEISVGSTRTDVPKRRYCRRCQCVKPPRAHHCSTCDRCIMKMDHHCPYVHQPSLFLFPNPPPPTPPPLHSQSPNPRPLIITTSPLNRTPRLDFPPLLCPAFVALSWSCVGMPAGRALACSHVYWPCGHPSHVAGG